MRMLAAAIAASLAATGANADTFSGSYAGIIGSLHLAGTTGRVNQYSGNSFGLFVVGYYPSSFGADLGDASIGGIVGYGWTTGRLYVGVDTDFSASFSKSKFQVSHPITLITTPPVAAGLYSDYTLSATIESDWLATARSRLGFVLSDNFMLYATAGIAAMDVNAETSLSAQATSQSGYVRINSIRFGPTMGAGLDFRINRQFNFRAEYQYAWMGNLDITNIGPHVGDLMTYRYNLDQHLLRIALTSPF